MVNKKTRKIEAQVVDAIRGLQAVQGSTQREIVNYISQQYSLPASEVKRQVQIALKRGVTYGIIQRMKGGCFTYNQQLFKEPHSDGPVEIPCKGRKRRRKSRKTRRRTKSKRRRSRTRKTRRNPKAEDITDEIDESVVNVTSKQSKSNSLLSKDTPEESDGSSTSEKSDETHD